MANIQVKNKVNSRIWFSGKPWRPRNTVITATGGYWRSRIATLIETLAAAAADISVVMA